MADPRIGKIWMGRSAGGNIKLAGSSTLNDQGPLPAGVSLQAIDGESMLTPTTMSNNYYSRNSYTFASSSSYNAGKTLWYAGYSWDDPRFFPISVFFGLYEDAGDMPKMEALQLAVSVAVTGGSNDTNIANAGVWTIDQTTPNAAMVACELDEPADAATINSFFNTTPNARQDHRFMHVNWTVNQLTAGDMGGTPPSTWMAANHFTTPNSTTKDIGWCSVDVYYFANSTIFQGTWDTHDADVFGITPPASTDQRARGSHYGQQIDVLRAWANGNNVTSTSIADQTSFGPSRMPLFSYLENYDGNMGEVDRRQITPPELNWGVWSQIVHGARAIVYFAYVNDHGGGQFSETIQSGQSVSIYTQGITTNTLISQLAPVINSPFALGYVTVSPHGYLFPVYELNWLNGGIEVCAKWYQGGNVTNQGLALVNGFYLFACTRYGYAATMPVSATFTVASGSVAHVVNESRSINIVAGQFTDSFANASTVHIYQIS
jgi:hypothetical protein